MAVDTAPPSLTDPLADRYRALSGTVLLSGVQALVRLLLDQRRRDGFDATRRAFVTGYPGSPLAGLDLELARRRDLLEGAGILHQPGLNEELAATSIAGSQLAALQGDALVEGVLGLWYAKSPGLDRASDALRHGNLMGAHPRGGVLVCVGDDPLAKSSSVPSTSEPTLYSLGMPILSPADPQEILDLGHHGVALSRASGLWVGMRLSASALDSTTSVVVDPERLVTLEPDHEVDGREFFHHVSAQLLGATLLELEATLYGARLEMARRYGVANRLNRVTVSHPHDRVGIAAAGPAYLAVRRALARLGLDDADLERLGVRLFKISMPYPLDARDVAAFADGLDEVVVVEDKRGFLEGQLREALYGLASAPRLLGKRDDLGRPLVPTTGEADADVVAAALARRLGLEAPPAPIALAPLPLARSAYFCSGCPHNRSVAVPEGTAVGSGSGCHGLILQMSPRQVGEVVGRFQMGGEGAMWIGMGPFVARDHFTQNMGDGTYAHSGVLAVRAAVAAGSHMTFKILANSTMAMTGGQSIPGGRGLDALVASLRAEGVGAVLVTTDRPRDPRYRSLPPGVEVWDRRRVVEAQRRLRATPGVSVLLHDQGCAAETRRRRHRGERAPRERVVVNPLVCEGCGDCGAISNCLSVRPVETARGRRVQIHQESCNLDYSCLEGNCPALVTARARHHHAVRPTELEEPPAAPVATRLVNVRLVGVGGTGVLTLSQVLAVAAHLDGLRVRSLDQTGIAQKGGPVVSDLRLGTTGESSARLGVGECDLYLSADPLVGADGANLRVCDPRRTVALSASGLTPTGRQVADIDLVGPDAAQLRERIASATSRLEWLDVAALAERHLGSDRFANVVLLGAALQLGLLPVTARSLERALELNAVDVEANHRALRLGRLAAIGRTPEMAPRLALPSPEGRRFAVTAGVVDESSLTPVAFALGDLAAYGRGAPLRRVTELVGRIAAAETALDGSPGELTVVVARQLARLYAPKDEYEVARLHRSAQWRAVVDDAAGPHAHLTFHLRPPWHRGDPSSPKTTLEHGAGLVLGALAAMRHLRGSVLDPLRTSAERREAGALAEEYAALIEGIAADLAGTGRERALELARSAETIRGFAEVRAAGVERYRARRAELGAPVAVDAAPASK